MKKILSFILSIISIFALCSCGAEKALSPGETFSDEHLSFTLTDFDSEISLNSSYFLRSDGKNTPMDNFLTPNAEDGFKDFTAEEGKIMITMSFTINNTGKEHLFVFNKWKAEVLYDDGISFEVKPGKWFVKGSDTWYPKDKYSEENMRIEPMAEKEYRACVEVPEEVISNTEAPLSVKFTCHADKEDTDYFINYKIR